MKSCRVIFILLLLVVGSISTLYAQQTLEQRFQQVEERLRAVAVMSPGMNEKVKLSVSGVSIQEFVRAC